MKTYIFKAYIDFSHAQSRIDSICVHTSKAVFKNNSQGIYDKAVKIADKVREKYPKRPIIVIIYVNNYVNNNTVVDSIRFHSQ